MNTMIVQNSWYRGKIGGVYRVIEDEHHMLQGVK
jgi:hypothetical protein